MYDILIPKRLKKYSLMKMMLVLKPVEGGRLVQNITVKKTMSLGMPMPHKFITVQLYDLASPLVMDRDN